MLVGLGVALLVVGALCEEQAEVECDLVLGGAAKIAPDPKSRSFYNIDHLKIVRPDESTAIVTGHVTFLKDFQRNFMVRIVINKEKWGKTWMAMSYDICDFCAELNNAESPFKLELDALDFPRECPFEPGQFNVNNLTVNTENMPINSANEGNYEAELCLYAALDKDCSNIERQGCVILPFIIECS